MKIYVVYYNTAIVSRKKICFQYFDTDISGNRHFRHNGAVYKVSPYSTVWNNDRYYLVGFCERHGAVTVFRVDRLYGVLMTEETADATPDDLDMCGFISQKFSMYSGDRQRIRC